MLLRKTGAKRRKTRMNGKKSDTTIEELFNLQKENQLKMFQMGTYGEVDVCELPTDNVSLSSYHLLHLVSELGEILEADKRWKSFRNEKYDKKGKAEEIADCFIVLLNIAMYSDIDASELSKAIYNKIKKVSDRVSKI